MFITDNPPRWTAIGYDVSYTFPLTLYHHDGTVRPLMSESILLRTVWK